jgi:hypothetical protein
MEMRLHGSERAPGLAGDLPERQVAEESQRDNLPIRLIETGDSVANVGSALGTERERCRVRCTGHVLGGSRVLGVQPSNRLSALRATDGDPDGNPREPRAERAVLAPCAKCPEGGHERFLGCVFGLVDVAQHPMAGTNNRRTLALDEDPEHIAIAREDAGDHGTIVIGDDPRRRGIRDRGR